MKEIIVFGNISIQAEHINQRFYEDFKSVIENRNGNAVPCKDNHLIQTEQKKKNGRNRVNLRYIYFVKAPHHVRIGNKN